MLYQFFTTQWTRPTRGDWTETVKADLEEFEIPQDFEYMKSKSKESFKRLVKKQGRKVALRNLKLKQERHTKMENIEYAELELKPYFKLPGIKVEQVRNLFKFRTRMAPFGDNFKGGRESVCCPLCKENVDSQSHSFNCKVLKEEIEIKCDLSEIYTDTISLETAETVTKIIETRKTLLEKEKVIKDNMDKS